MIASWMLYTLLVSAGIFVASLLVERSLRAAHIATRLVWIAAMCLPFIGAALAIRLWNARAESRPAVRASTATSVAPINPTPVAKWVPHTTTVAVPAASTARFDFLLLAFWIATCVLTAGMFAAGIARLRRLRSSAVITDVAGVQVALTKDSGPLVFGVIEPRIFLPRWVLDLEPAQQQLVVAHEQQHVRTRDPALLAFAGMTVAITPWNPLLWCMLRRLRQAIEIDCDARVMALHPDSQAYGGLLLSVASRQRAGLLPATGLAASVSSLERRLTLMKTNQTDPRVYRAAMGLAVPALVLVATAMIPRPVPRQSANLGSFADQGTTRKTARVHVTGALHPVAYKVYTTGGNFTDVGNPSVTRTDGAGQLSGDYSGDRVFDVDLTNGSIHFVSKDTSSLHVEAAMSGTNSSTWLSGTAPHVVLDKGGAGISFGIANPPDEASINPYFEFQVDRAASVVHSVPPRYSATSTEPVSRGVVMQFVVDESGQVDMSSVKALSSGPREFVDAIKAVLPSWRFEPARLHGRNVKQLVQMPIYPTLPRS